MEQRIAMETPIPIPDAADNAARETVSRAVLGLLERSAQADPDFVPPPVDPRIVAGLLGVPVHFADIPPGVDAMLISRKGVPRILANRNVRHLGRLNFTIAHEIGHTLFENASGRALLRAHDRRTYDATPEGRVLESLCDHAAAELLMPMPWVAETVGETGFNASAVPAIAARFEVSLEAAALRLVESRKGRGGACAVGFFQHGVRPSMRVAAGGAGRAADSADTAAYRVRRLFRSPRFPAVLPPGKSVPPTSVIYRASLGCQVLRGREMFGLGRRSAVLEVSAVPLLRTDKSGEPPIVCAVLTAD